MNDYQGIENLRRKLETKRNRVLLRYKYYDMKNFVKDFNKSVIPQEFKNFAVSLGWCAKAVDSLADRLSFEGFTNDRFYLNEIFKMNNPDILTDSAFHAALVSSCSFIYISLDENEYPRLQVIDGSDATGIINPITRLLTEGYAVLKRNKSGHPVLEAYFIPGRTFFYENKRLIRCIDNVAPAPLLVPIINRPDASRQFGHSQISRSCMDITQSVLRTLKRSEISSEFYSFPQKYLLGTAQDSEVDGEKANLSSFLNITVDENGNKPQAGQFAQQSMTPFIEQMRMYASLFAAETGLTLDDLGFPSDNPSSYEAIKAAHESLRLRAKKAQKNFFSGLLNVGYLSACLRDNIPYERGAFMKTEGEWMPLFEPDMSSFSTLGDGIIKINQAVPGAVGKKTLKSITGLNIDVDDEADINNDIFEGGDAD